MGRLNFMNIFHPKEMKSSQNAFSSRIVRLFFLFSDYFMPMASEVHRVHPIQTDFDVNLFCFALLLRLVSKVEWLFR